MELFKSNTLNKKFQENGFVKLQLIGPKSVKNLKDIYLKYKTPITPHQKDPRAVNVKPLLKFLLFTN